MRILSLIKQVPHPQAISSIILDQEKKTIVRENIPLCMNPHDKAALELALRIKREEDEIVCLSMGPEKAREVIEEAYAMGADRGYLITDKALSGSDTLITAKVFSNFFKKFGPFDLIFCGERSIDGATGQVGPQFATFVSIPFFTRVFQIEKVSNGFLIKARWENKIITFFGTPPFLVTVIKDIKDIRIPKVSDIIEATKKEIEFLSIRDLGLSKEEVGLLGSPTKVYDMVYLKSGRMRKILSGEPEKVAKDALKILKEIGAI